MSFLNYFFKKKPKTQCTLGQHDFVLINTSKAFDYYECKNKKCNHSKGIHKEPITT